ncbi:hypothetical protein [Hymenobacter negativus]|uniref:Uncharacterized protein n=1 Tax=Hymenobacter negativus TaxID=2795026 RepID=A0ABS0QCJ3_9BACT|nr:MULTISPECIES: hypothetical protein [Bacteria]MBH8560058.1 hypothetical protein [Hymenobacter negativus]MBH8570531.1 hypothetical protein [Hymenobacter negativus]MBR7210270.1 hypothetical protein [Microvirga sp. STS02]
MVPTPPLRCSVGHAPPAQLVATLLLSTRTATQAVAADATTDTSEAEA